MVKLYGMQDLSNCSTINFEAPITEFRYISSLFPSVFCRNDNDAVKEDIAFAHLSFSFEKNP